MRDSIDEPSELADAHRLRWAVSLSCWNDQHGLFQLAARNTRTSESVPRHRSFSHIASVYEHRDHGSLVLPRERLFSLPAIFFALPRAQPERRP